MRRSRIAAAVVMAACVVWCVFASCVQSGATPCGDQLCPATLTCIIDDIDSHCVDPAIVAACKGRVDGMPCNLGAGGSGTCRMNLCDVGYCGDGKVEFNEDCDGTNLNGMNCIDFGGTTPGGLKCTSACTFDKSGCNSFCGDGMVAGIEQCDGSNFAGKSCVDYGFYGGKLACTSSCMVNVANCVGRCGDGVIDTPQEQCDGQNLGTPAQTCAGLGYKGSVVPLACGSNCTYSGESCTCGGQLCAKNPPSNQQCVAIGGGVSQCQ